MADPTLFPAWLLQRLEAAWPAHWREIIAASNQHPPMTLRVNRRRRPRRLCRELAAAGLSARAAAGPAGFALMLERPPPRRRCPVSPMA
jgi:16S rRNA (cytosine967-C5)-methyltransferase